MEPPRERVVQDVEIPLPNTAAPGQTRGCEAGNEKFVAGKTVIGHAPATFGTTTSTPAAEEEGESESGESSGGGSE